MYHLFVYCLFFFFFNDTATTEIYTLSLHDALPILTQKRPHDVHLRVARGGVAARGVDRLEDEGALRDSEPGAAVFLGDQRGEVAGLRQLVDELLGVLAPRVEVAPVLARIALADLQHARLEGALLVRERAIDRRHRRDPYRPLNCARRFSLNARTPSSRSSVTTVALYADRKSVV